MYSQPLSCSQRSKLLLHYKHIMLLLSPLTQLYSRLIMAAMSGLGKSVLLPTTLATNLNPKVVVRRKDTTIHTTTLIDEHIRQLTTDFPDYLEKFIKLPPSYEFDESRLHHMHGFLSDSNPTTNQECSLEGDRNRVNQEPTRYQEVKKWYQVQEPRS